jgi:thiol-disulfide isomerase/thioredoxin
MKPYKYMLTGLCLLAATWLQAQDVDQIVEQYRSAIADIETIHCQVAQLDTFVTGHVWDYQGELTLMRNREDTLFGFQYKASKEVGEEALYDGRSDFQIDHEKQTYELNTNPRDYILGSPGGQLVVAGLMYDQDADQTPELIATDPYFVLRYSYPDLEEYDVRQREKKIFLDKKTFLPVKVISRQVTLDKKQVITRIISDVRINQPEDQQAFQKDFLTDYKMIVEEPDKDLHADLLQTKVKDFQLETFTGETISTKSETGKLLLLDFWEVWCGPCVESMPKVQELANKYGSQGLDVVGVLMDPNSQDSAEKMISRKGVSFTQAFGSPDLREYFRVYAIPQYVLIDQNGIIQQVFTGYSKKMESRIKVLLAKAR